LSTATDPRYASGPPHDGEEATMADADDWMARGLEVAGKLWGTRAGA
jgi:hypothetical protein